MEEGTPKIKALLWNRRGTRLMSIYHDGSAQEIALVEDAVPLASSRITLGTDAGRFRISGGIEAMDWSPDGVRVACALGDGTVRIVDLLRKMSLTYERHRELFPAWPRAVAWSPDGSLIASGGTDRCVHIWDASSGASLRSHSGYCAEEGHKGDVTALSWSPDGQQLASGSCDGTVIVVPAVHGAGALWRSHEGEVTSLAWSPNGAILASAGRDALVRIWSPRTNTLEQLYKEHASAVMALAWSHNGCFIASGSLDGSVQIWQVATGACFARYNELHEIHALSWPRAGLLAYEGPQNTVRLVFFQEDTFISGEDSR